jgi:hypothetical protein
MNNKLINNEADKFGLKVGAVSLLINTGIAYLYMSRFQGFDTGIQILLAFLITILIPIVSFVCVQHKFYISLIILAISSIWYAGFITGFGVHLFKYKEITLVRTIVFLFSMILELGSHIMIWCFLDQIINKYKHIMRRE